VIEGFAVALGIFWPSLQSRENDWDGGILAVLWSQEQGTGCFSSVSLQGLRKLCNNTVHSELEVEFLLSSRIVNLC
jgi:hypothetical protein